MSAVTTFNYATSDGSAKLGEDYGQTVGTLSIAAGATSATIVVPVYNDTADDPTDGSHEPQTQFYLNLSNVSGGATLAKSQGIGSIYDPSIADNPPQQCTCNDGDGNFVTEPNQATGGMTGHFTFPTLLGTLYNGIVGGLTFLGLDMPHPTITVEDQLSPDVLGASYIQAVLTVGGVAGQAEYYSPAGYTPGQTVDFSAQVDAGSLPTGRYAYTMSITEMYPDGTSVVRTYNGHQNIVNLDSTTVGAGWMLRGLAQLYPQSGGVSLSDGAGNLYFFTQNPDGSFSRPEGEPGFSTLVKNQDGSYTLTDKNQNVAQFNAQGLLQSLADADGNKTVLNWNGTQLLSITDPEGRVCNLGYSGGQLTTLEDFAGRITSLAYNSYGQLSTVTRPNPGYGETQPVVQFGYDPATGQMTSTTDFDGTTSYIYNAARALTQINYPDGSTVEYDAPGTQALTVGPGSPNPGGGTQTSPAPLFYNSSVQGSFTDQNGHVSHYAVGRFGQDTVATDPLGNSTTTVFNGEGEATQISAPPLTVGGQPLVTVQKFDASGNLIERDLPDGGKETWQYDTKFNLPTLYVDPGGRETLWSLDASNGNILTVTHVMGTSPNPANDITTNYTYTTLPTQSGQPPAGLVATEIDPRGIETEYEYNPHGLLTVTVYAAGTPDQGLVVDTYNSSDDLVAESDELGRTTNYVVDALGRTVETDLPPPDPAEPASRPVFKDSFDPMGRVVSETDGRGLVTTRDYDSVGNLVRLQQPDPTGGTNYTVTAYGFDPADNPTSVTDPMQRVSSTTFDADNRPVTQQDPNPANGGATGGPVTTVYYDPEGDVIKEIDAAGNETDNTFDDFGDLLTTTGPPDANGNRPTVTFQYNADHEVIAKIDALGHETTYVRDNLGRIVEEDDPSPDGTSPGPVLKWQYDKDSNVVETIDAMQNATLYVFDNRNRQTQETDANGGTTQDIFDAAGQMVEEIDPMGRITQYSHDAEGNLSAVIAPNPQTGGLATDGSTKTTYGHDYDGNTTVVTNPQLASTFYTYDDLNQRTQEQDPPPTPSGASPVTTWQFDADGEVTKETDPLGRSLTTTLDGMGRQTNQQDFTGVLTSWAYNSLSEVTTQTVSGSGQPHAVTTNTWDNLGNKTSVQDPNGGLTKMAFDLAGNMTSLTDPSNNNETWTRDNLDRVTQDKTTAGTRTFQYNLNGDVTDEVDRNGRERQFTFNSLDQQTAENWLGPGGQGSATVTHTVTGFGSYAGAVQTIALPWATGGTWTLSFDGKTTYPLQSTAGVMAIAEALEALNRNIFVDTDEYVSGSPGDPIVVDFTALAGQSVPMLTADSSQLTGMTRAPAIVSAATGHVGTDTTDSISFDAGQPVTAGTFYLSIDGHATSPLDYFAPATTVEAALAALPGIGSGNVFVEHHVEWFQGEGEYFASDWTIRFVGALSGQHVDAVTVSNFVAASAGAVSVSSSYHSGGPGADDVQQLVINATSGTFTLTYTYAGHNTETTQPLPYNATAAQVAAALNALDFINYGSPTLQDVTVSGSGTSTDPYVITFVGDLSGEAILPLTATVSGVTINSVTTSYNLDGQITSIADADSKYSFNYNGQGQQTQVDNSGTPGVPDIVLASRYDTLGDRTLLAATVGGTPDFLNSYSFDSLQRMTSETQQGQSGGNAVATKGVSFGYDPLGDITSIQRYTNITQAPSPATDAADTTLGYSSLGQLTSEDHSHNGSTLENLSWTFDTLDRVSTFSSNDGLATYGYDNASQVVSATYSGSNPPPNVAETYDPNGNRIGAGYVVGANNLLSSDGTFNYTHDNEGNVVKRVRISTAPANDYEVDYSWDYRNRLTDVYFYNNSHVLTKQEHMVYDVFNNLIEQDVDPTGSGTFSQVTHNVWDIQSPLPPGEGQGEGAAAMGANIGSGSAAGAGEGGIVMQFNGSQQLTNRYLNGPNTNAADQYFTTLAEEAVNSLSTAGTVTFDLADNLGSVRNVVSATGSLLDHANYDVFGSIGSESDPSVHHLTGFAGGLTDANTGFDLFSVRDYNPSTGRFIQPDHIGLAGGDTNEERYVGNDPADTSDPSGEWPAGNTPRYFRPNQNRWGTGPRRTPNQPGGPGNPAGSGGMEPVPWAYNPIAAFPGYDKFYHEEANRTYWRTNDERVYRERAQAAAAQRLLPAMQAAATRYQARLNGQGVAVGTEEAEQLLVRQGRRPVYDAEGNEAVTGFLPGTARDYVSSCTSPITLRRVGTGETWWRYSKREVGRGNFLTKIFYNDPETAVNDLALNSSRNDASFRQRITATRPTYVLESGIRGGNGRQTIILDPDAFEYGSGVYTHTGLRPGEYGPPAPFQRENNAE